MGMSIAPQMPGVRFGTSVRPSADQRVANALNTMNRALSPGDVGQVAQLARGLELQHYNPSLVGIGKRGEIYVVASMDTQHLKYDPDKYYRVLFGLPGQVKEVPVMDVIQPNRHASKLIELVSGDSIQFPPPSFLRNRTQTVTEVNGQAVQDEMTV